MNNTVKHIEKDNFTNNVFSAKEWSAPTLSNPDEIKTRIASFKLEGRTIKKMKFIGLSYYHTRDWIESRAYDVLNQLDEEERQKQSEYNNIAPGVQFSQYAEIDEPFLIEFEDGDVFEIDTPQESKFCFSMNCIPWWIDAGTNLPNLDANLFFAPCIDKTITAVEVNTYLTDKDTMFNTYFDKEHSKRELVSNIVLWLDDGNGISVEGFIDYCDVALIDPNMQVLTLPFQELKSALFNWEDLHIDEVNGFKPESSTFFFGEVGEAHTNTPFMTLTSEKNESKLYISEDDFFLFGLAITWVTEEFFDEYGNYEFTANQWSSVLSKAETILSFETFDDLFECLTNINIRANQHFILKILNCRGVELWKNREKHLVQLNDMKQWTKIVLSDDDIMNVYGF